MRHLALLPLLGFSTVVRPSQACTIAVDDTVLVTFPEQGQEAVPTDVAILIDLSLHIDAFAPLPEGLFTLRTPEGEVVPMTTERPAVWHAQVRPAAALTPNTRYELEVQLPLARRPSITRTLTFTTGTGPLEAELAPPVAAMQHWRFSSDVALTTCDFDRAGTCIALPAGELVEATYLLPSGEAGDAGSYLYKGPFTANFTDENPGHPYRCLRLRRRAVNGTYSEPAVLCGEDALTFELSGNSSLTCSPEGIVHDGPQSLFDEGCSMTPGSGSRNSLAALVALSMLAMRRRPRP